MNTLIQLAAKIQTGSIVLYVVLGVLVVGLLVFPTITNRRRQKDFVQMLNNLSVGDRIMTTSGMIGTIKKINRNKTDGAVTIIISTGENTTMEFDAGAIARILYSVNPAPTTQKSSKHKEETQPAEETNTESKDEPKAEEKPATEEKPQEKPATEPKVAKVKKSK